MFSSNGGDIGYFDDLNSSLPPNQGFYSLRSIRTTFEALESLHRQLDHLKESSEQSAAYVSFAFALSIGFHSTESPDIA